MDSATIAEKPSLVKSILPTFSHWATALKPFLMRPPNQSLAIMQPLRGAVNLIERQGRAEMAVPEIDRDGHGYSSAFRMAMFTVKWIKSSEIFALVEQEQKVLLSKYFALFLQLSGDNVNIAGSMPLWNQDRMQGLEPDVLDLIADTQTLLASWIQCSGNQESHFIFQTQSQLLADSHGMSALAYYSACAYANLTLELNEQQGVQRAETGLNNVREIRKSPDIFTTVALILCAPESNNLSRLCNELVADATGIKYGEPIDQGRSSITLGKLPRLMPGRTTSADPVEFGPRKDRRVSTEYASTALGIFCEACSFMACKASRQDALGASKRNHQCPSDYSATSQRHIWLVLGRCALQTNCKSH